ncbi:MAG: L-threonylcarbamoyladenylate synthase [Candidatus Helarchaeota archaeon]
MIIDKNIKNLQFLQKPVSKEQINAIADNYVLKGKTIIYPTDTLYGLGGNPLDINVIKKVFSIKRRSFEKGLPVLSHSIEKVSEICYLNEIAVELGKKYWPGQMTLILQKKEIVPDILTGYQNTVAIRIPKHDFCLKLMEAANGYLIGTSANLSSEPDPVQISDISPDVLSRVDLIIDMGSCKHGKPSTIVDVSTSEIRILRKGSLDLSGLVDES